MSQLPVLSGILVVCLLAGLAVKSAVAERRLDARIRGTLLLEGGTGSAGRGLRLLLSYGRFLATRRERERLATRLRQAGFFRNDALNLFLLSRVALLAVFWLASIVLIAPEDMAALITPGALLKQMFAGFLASRASEWWLNDRIRTHTTRLRRRVPEALELLTICVGSGLTFEKALKQVADEIGAVAPELAAEFDSLHSELTINENRQAVLERFGRRSGVKELQTVARTMLQSMRYGTPLVDALQTTANQSRFAQLDEIKERASAAPARMSIPLIVFILFPVIGLLGAPAVVNLIRTMQGL